MPGILPMKVIKVGTSAQSRIAQACDRCRSKKIRCDGIRPCCSQCSNVGFECKTSDKLSRRAFPRGYTESLEERVRALEGEVRELKDLLDEKDEKIDMLSRMHNNRRISHSSLGSSPVLVSSPEEAKEDTFRLQYSQPGTESEGDSAFLGASTGRIFVDAFKRKLQDCGKSCSGFNPAGFLPSYQESSEKSPETNSSTIPPRLFSDRCINIFWQEHAPLFPVLHKPTFLRLYEDYVAKPEEMVDNQKLAKLHLVFCIAGFSSDLPDKDDIALCERQWRKSLSAIILDKTLSTLQCLVLACLYCSQTGDYESLQTYKAIAVGLSQRLGLHYNQKRFSNGPLLTETRKKVFWSLYTVDCFSAASMGLPQLINDSDIECKYPTAIDDEYVEESRYLPTLPGETSKLSNALALFDATRILSKVLRKLYPANVNQDLSLQDMAALESELDQWSEKLPQHLKLTFIADKPSVRVTGDRSALLSLAYYHIRSLIHRPAIGSTLGSKASASIIAVASASKAIVQIIELLEERSMSFSFCINKNTTLTLCGLSLLYQGLDLKKEGHLIREGQRMVCAISSYLDKYNAPGAANFKRLISSLAPSSSPAPTSSPHSSMHRSNSGPVRTKPIVSPQLPRQMISPTSRVLPTTSRSNSSSAADIHKVNSDLLLQQERMRRATLHSFPTIQSVPIPHINGQSRAAAGLGQQRKARSGSNGSMGSSAEYRSSSSAVMDTPIQQHRGLAAGTAVRSSPSVGSESGRGSPLDYISLGTPSPPMEMMSMHPKIRRVPSGSNETQFISAPQQQQLQQDQFQKQQQQPSLTSGEWESLLSSLDSGSTNIFDAVYGGTNHGGVSLPIHTLPQNSGYEAQQQCQPEENVGAFEDWELANDAASAGWVNLEFDPATGDVGPQSVFSYSEESHSSDGEAGSSHLEYPGLVEYRQMFELF